MTTTICFDGLDETLDTLENAQALDVQPQQLNVALVNVDFLKRGDDVEDDPKRIALLEGITEDLCDLLNSSPELRLCPQSQVKSSALSYEEISLSRDWGALQSFSEICDVSLMMALSITIHEAHVEISVDTLSPRDHLIVARYHVRLAKDSLLKQLGSVALELSRQLKVGLICPDLERADIAEAVDLIFEARELAKRTWHTGVSAALELYEAAMTRSPQDAVILAEAARVGARSSFIDIDAGNEALALAAKRATEAYRLAPMHPQCLWALGYVRFYQGESAEAVELLERAQELGIDRAELNDLIGRIRCEIGPLSQAIERLEYALALDSSLFTTRLDLSRLSAYVGDWDRVDALLDCRVRSDAELGALSITRARLDLWRPSPAKWIDDRDVSREGELFQTLINLFYAVKVDRALSPHHERELEHLIDRAQPGGRMRILYLQFLCECMALIHGPNSGEVSEVIQRLHVAGLTDMLWRERCSLLS